MRPVYVETRDGLCVARDDLLSGGTKRRAMARWLPETGATEFVYAATQYGLAGLALAHVCAEMGTHATLFYSRPKIRPPVFDQLEALGARILLTDTPLPLAEVEGLATRYAQEKGAFFIPPGCKHPDFMGHMATVLKQVPINPPEVWVSAVTGTFTCAAQLAWPEAAHHAVCVVKTPEDTGAAVRHFAPQKYHQAASLPPPYPSFPQCDAKVWEFAKKHAKNGALIWNIGA